MIAEDDITDARGGAWKEDWYGVREMTYHDKNVPRKIIAEYDLDPNPTLYWIVEGATEYTFITHFLREGFGIDPAARGIEIVDGGGMDRIVHLTGLLGDARTREVLAMVTLDDDAQGQAVLEQLLDEDLITAEYYGGGVSSASPSTRGRCAGSPTKLWKTTWPSSCASVARKRTSCSGSRESTRAMRTRGRCPQMNVAIPSTVLRSSSRPERSAYRSRSSTSCSISRVRSSVETGYATSPCQTRRNRRIRCTQIASISPA